MEDHENVGRSMYLFDDWIMWKQGWFFKRHIERNYMNYKNVLFFWGGNLPFLLGWPLTRPSVFLFSPPAKKKSGWKTKVWYLAYVNHQWILYPLVILAFWCLTKLLWVECLLLTHLLPFSGQVRWMLCLWSWENQPIVMTGIQGKRQGGDVTWWERERKRGQGSWDDQIRLFLLWHCI